MKKTSSRILALVLCVCMVLGMAPTLALAAGETAPSYLSFGSVTGYSSNGWRKSSDPYKVYLYQYNSSAGTLTLANEITTGDYVIFNSSTSQAMNDFANVACTAQGGLTNVTLTPGTTTEVSANSAAVANYLFTITDAGNEQYTIQSASSNTNHPNFYLTLELQAATPTIPELELTQEKPAYDFYITRATAGSAFYITINAPHKDPQQFLAFGSGSDGWLANTAPYVMYLYHTTGAGGDSGTRVTDVISGDHYMFLASTSGTQTKLPVLHVAGTITNQCRADTTTAGNTLANTDGTKTTHTFTITAVDSVGDGPYEGPYVIKSDYGDFWLTLNTSGNQLEVVTSEAAATRFYITASTNTENAVYITSVEPYHDPVKQNTNFLAFQDEGGSNRGWISRETPQLLYFYKYTDTLEDASAASELSRADTLDVTGNVYYMIISYDADANRATALACQKNDDQYVTFCYNLDIADIGEPTITIGSTVDDPQSVLFRIDAVDQLGESMEHHIISAKYPEQHLSLENSVELGTRKALVFTDDENHHATYVTPVSMVDDEEVGADAAKHTYYISLGEYYPITFDPAPTKDFSSIQYLTFGLNNTDRWATGSTPFKMYLYELPEGESWTANQVATRTTTVKSGYHYLIISSQSSTASNGAPRAMYAYLNNNAYRVNQWSAPSDNPKTIALSDAAHRAQCVFYITETTKTEGSDTTMYLIESHDCPGYYLTMDSTTNAANGLLLNNNPKTHVKFYITPSERYADEEAVYITVGGSGADPEPTFAEMFDSAPDNTWVFTGGAVVAGGVEQTGGKRNFVGQFEEYIRYNAADNTDNQLQRYTINTGKAGQTLADLVSEEGFAARVSNYNPRAVVYVVSPEDMQDNQDNTETFKTNLKAFIDKCFALRSGNSLVVIQKLKGIITEEYSAAVDEVIEKYNSGRIKMVETTLTEEHLTNGVPNAAGHLEMARHLAGQIQNVSLAANFPYITSGRGSHMTATPVAAPSTYSGTAPVVTTTDGFQVTVAEEVTDWTYTLTLSNGVVINGSVTGSSTTTIPGVPTGATYRLTVLTDGGTNQLPTVGELTETAAYAHAAAKLKELLNTKENEQITWLFMGDSITHGAAWTLGYDSISQTFEKYLHDENALNRPQDVVVNTAVSGATTDGTKSTISNIQYRLTQYEDAVPDVVSIMLGTNDWGSNHAMNNDTYKANMETIIKAIRGGDGVEGVNPEAFIILRCPTYATSRDGIDQHYGAVMKAIADADDTHHTIYIDQYTPIADVADSTYTWITNTQLFYGNNLHPGPLGQLIMARQFIRALGLWNWDNAIANLDYEVDFQTAENGGVDVGDYVSIDPASDSITLNITNLNTAYEGGTLGHTTLTATKDGVSYTITVPAGSESVTLTNLPHEEYTVKVSSVLTGSAAKRVTFDAVQKTLKSSDKSIKSITVNGAEVRTPWGNESWTLELEENSNYPEVNDIVVTPNDSNAKAEVTKGDGDGVFTITVTAEDGTSEEHTLRVTIYSHEHKWGSVKFWWRGSSRDDSADKDEWLTKDFGYYVEHVDAIASATRVCTADDEEEWETKTKQTATMKVEITAQQAPTCEAGGTLTVSVTATFDGDPNGHTAEHTFNFDAIGHNWSSTVTWGEWTENDKDGWTITAKKICANDENHYLEGQVNVSVETTPAECSKAGESVYSATATFDGDGETYNAPNTKVVPISQLGHDWNDPVFVWAADHSSATASRTCKRNDTHIEQAQKVEVNSTTTEAACEKAGETVYTATATFLNDSNEYKDEQKVAIPALEHDWNKPVFNWAEDNSSATATRTCKNDTNNEHAQTVDAVITSETTLEPSCEDEGTATLTATAKFGEDEKDTFSEDKENVALPAAGHKTELVSAKPSTTTEKGNLEHYKCSVCEKLFWDQEAKQPITNPDDVLLDLSDHDNHVWTKFVFTWHEDGMNTTATLTGSECSEGSEEKPCTQSESVAATMTWDEESLQEATCEEDGSVTFTATATLGGVEKAEDHEVILAALGHTLELVEAKAPTCEDEGNDAYYQCSVCGDLFDGDQETPLDEIPTIDALGHDWGDPVFNWTKTADGYTAAATFTCGNDGDHVETVDATVTSEETKAPTATEKGTMTYTATVNFDGKDYSATKDEDIPATGTPEVPSDDAAISGITVAGVAAEKGEDGTWSVKLPYGSELPGAEDIAVDAAEGATCEVVDNGDGTYTITVTAEDKTTTATYTLSVTIAEKEPEPEVPSDDATISGITVSGKKAAKNSDGTWSVKLPYGSELPGAEDIAVDAAEGATCEVVDNGDGTYTITVTAEDKTTTATYTLNVTVAEKPANTPTKPKTESTPETPDTTTTTETSSDGVTGTTTKDKAGNTTGIEVVVPEDAADSDGVLTAPVEVEVADSVDEAPEIDVTVKGGGSAKVKIPVTDVTPGTVAVVVDEDGNETILRDSIVTEDGVLLEVENGAKVKIVDNTKEFEDIDNVPWAKDAIISTVARELFHGTTETTFSPDLNTDRGMVVTLLHRMEYEPDFGSSDFIDVANSSWYADAVAWGQSTGVVKGYSDEAFGPNDAVTREQLAVMLYNYAAFTGMDTTARGDLSAFTDGAATSDWAAEAMEWAIGTGLMVGFGDGTLGAGGYATRAQVAVVIQRFCELRFA